MAYDALAESVALIASGVIDGPAQLSRRRRHVPLAVDVDGDAAVTVFIRRSVGRDEIDMHLLHRRDGQWRLLGGGSGPGDLDELAGPWSSAGGGGAGRVQRGTSVAVNADRLVPWGARFLHSCWLDLASEVSVVDVAARTITVPWHHHVAVVWAGARAPRAVLRDADGIALGRLDLG